MNFTEFILPILCLFYKAAANVNVTHQTVLHEANSELRKNFYMLVYNTLNFFSTTQWEKKHSCLSQGTA